MHGCKASHLLTSVGALNGDLMYILIMCYLALRGTHTNIGEWEQYVTSVEVKFYISHFRSRKNTSRPSYNTLLGYKAPKLESKLIHLLVSSERTSPA